jgi:undecaprenyl-diphosphatase
MPRATTAVDRRTGEGDASHRSPAVATLTLAGGLLLIASMFTVDPMLARAASHIDPQTRELFYHVTTLGQSDWVFVLCALSLLGLLLLLRRKPPRRLAAAARLLLAMTLLVLAAVAGSGLVVQLVKHIVGRARPKYLETLGAHDFSPFMFDAGHASFPSGHTATAFALATLVTLLRRQWAVPAFAFAVLIGISRIATGAHYLSDVIGGAAVGTVFTLLVHRQMLHRRWLFTGDGNGGARLRGRGIMARFPRELRAFLQHSQRERQARRQPSSAQ